MDKPIKGPPRALGASELRVSPLGLGGMSLSGSYGESDDESSLRLIRRALDLGVTLIDTADVYGFGHNEELFGRALKGRRDGVVVGTKFGFVLEPGGAMGVCGRPDYVAQACDASLRRLGVETLDLYYLHRVDPVVPIEETVGAMARLVEAGKIRALGLSEAAPATIRRAHAVHPIAAIQTEYSLFSREVGEETLATCRELGVAFVAYSPLGRGMLAANAELRTSSFGHDYRQHHPRFWPNNLAANLQLCERLAPIAAAKGCSIAQLALAWLLAQGEDVIPIPGTKRLQRLEENLAATALSLSPEDRTNIEMAIPSDAVAGARHPDAQMSMVQR